MGTRLAMAGLALGTLFAATTLNACAVAQARDDVDAPLKATPDGRPLVVTFSEDFSKFGTLCDGRGRWRTTYKDGSSEELAYRRTIPSSGGREVYVDPCFTRRVGVEFNPLHLDGRRLDIVADRAPAKLAPLLEGHPYVSGVITTQPFFSQTYGYFEMKARLPRGKGLWPAFWLLPADGSWPPEIDVMESIGDPSLVWATVHSKSGSPPGVKVEVPGASSDFHVFAASWDPRSIVWFIDGREVARQATPADVDKPMYMLINLGVGGHWPGDPDASTQFPARYTIDYVRAYRFAP